MPLLTLADGCTLHLHEDAEPAAGGAPARVLMVPGLVLSSPALDAGMNPLQKCLAAMRAPLLPHVSLGNRLDPATLAAAPRWAVPTLLLYAGADRCVAARGSDAFAVAAPVAQLLHRRYDGLAHELFNEPEPEPEPEREQVLLDLRAWLGLTLRRGALQTAPTGATPGRPPQPPPRRLIPAPCHERG